MSKYVNHTKTHKHTVSVYSISLSFSPTLAIKNMTAIAIKRVNN